MDKQKTIRKPCVIIENLQLGRNWIKTFNVMATIYEVAEGAGVSPMTAARILSGSSQRSKHREKVLQSAKKLGYVRNVNAANLRTGRTHLIGIMVPFIDNPFYTKFLQEMHDALTDKGYQSLIACSFGEGQAMLQALELFGSYSVDGVVMDISEGVVTDALKEKLAKTQNKTCPVVVTGARRDDIPYDHLYLDNERAVGKLIRFFVARGHSRMGFVGGFPENLNIQQRVTGFRQALADTNLKCSSGDISLGSPDLDSVRQRAHRLLRSKNRPTAIICTSDMIAMVIIRAAIELGLRVPQDVAVAGFDDITQASLTTPSVTTIRQPLRAMAFDIVSMLLSRLENPKAPIREQEYEAELILREST